MATRSYDDEADRKTNGGFTVDFAAVRGNLTTLYYASRSEAGSRMEVPMMLSQHRQTFRGNRDTLADRRVRPPDGARPGRRLIFHPVS